MNQSEQSISVTNAVVKVASVWAAVGITSWADAASAAAFLYTCALFLHLIWKNYARPFCENRGWLVRRNRRRDDR